MAATVILLSDYRVARRASDVLRELLRDLPWLSGVNVEFEREGSLAIVVSMTWINPDVVRAVVPKSVNGVPVRVRPG